MTEQELRNSEVPTPESYEELIAYIQGLVEQEHDYGTCVYAMSMSAVAAFIFVAGRLGVTGFQASCADLDILTRIRNIKGGFILLKTKDLLYPQYDLRKKLNDFITSDETETFLKEEAKKHLAQDNEFTHPNVIAHWKKLIEENE